jgi:hypothetical protein
VVVESAIETGLWASDLGPWDSGVVSCLKKLLTAKGAENYTESAEKFS